MSVQGARLLTQACTFLKVGDVTWALNSYERAYNSFMQCVPIEYAGASDAKRGIAEIHEKQGNVNAAATAYTESGRLSVKGGDRRRGMQSFGKAAYLRIEEGDIWQALFLFEELEEYYAKRDLFKCRAYSYDACLCIVAIAQTNELLRMFTLYRSHLEPEQEAVITGLLELKGVDKPTTLKNWWLLVFGHLSTKSS